MPFQLVSWNSHTTTATQALAPPIALPIALPTAIPIALAVAHHPANLTITITGKPHTSTPRIVLTSYSMTVMHPWPLAQRFPVH